MGFAIAGAQDVAMQHPQEDDACEEPIEEPLTFQEMRIITDDVHIEAEEIPKEIIEDGIFQLEVSYPVVDHWLKYNAETKTLSEVYIVFIDGSDEVSPPKSPSATRTIDIFEIV